MMETHWDTAQTAFTKALGAGGTIVTNSVDRITDFTGGAGDLIDVDTAGQITP